MKSATFYQICWDAQPSKIAAQPFSFGDWCSILVRQLISGSPAWKFAALEDPQGANHLCRAAWANGETPMAAADMLHVVAIERAAGR